MSSRRGLRCIWATLVLLFTGCFSFASPMRQEPRVQANVKYGFAGGQFLLLDIYSPTGCKSVRPAVLLVHGGGWAMGDKQADYIQAVAKTLAQNGFKVFSANYRLATPTGNHYPAQLDDVQRAVRWIRANAKKYDIDPHRLGALGDSAGGHLAALLGTRDTRYNGIPELKSYSSRVNCVVDLYGPTDFTIGKNKPVNSVIATIVATFIGKTYKEAPALYRDVSPIAHVDKRSVPFLIFHGTADPLVPIDQSQRLYDALRRNGIEATFIKMPGDGHGFSKPENQQRFALETISFLRKHLKP